MMSWADICRTKNPEAVRQAAAVLDVNERDERGRTPLMLLITQRMPVQALDLLIERGADLEAEDKLGDTSLKKAVKFNRKETVVRLLEAGARLDSPHGILATAWNAARGRSKEIADLLLATTGAVRLTLTDEERDMLDDILYDESLASMCRKIRRLTSPVLLHAVVSGYNWDGGPEPMLAAFENPACPEITLSDMYDLLDGDYWIGQEQAALNPSDEAARFRELAVRLKERLKRFTQEE